MTDHHPPTKPAELPPTARQQRYLRQLALQRGVTFTVPKTRAQASRAIDILKRRLGVITILGHHRLPELFANRARQSPAACHHDRI